MSIFAPSNLLRVQVRAMLDGDLPDVMAIDKKTSPTTCWGCKQFHPTTRPKNRMLVVATYGESVMGFTAYQLDRPFLTVEKLTVMPNVQRQGVGSQLLCYIVGKLEQFARSGFTVLVPESSIDGCKFLASYGLGSSLIPGAFEAEDGIRFVYRVLVPAECVGI